MTAMSGRQRIGALRALWNFAKRQRLLQREGKEVCVGTDQGGNKYFWRRPNPDLNIKELRYVVPPEDRIDPVMLVLPEKVPQEWEAWLRGRREEPPTEEELKKNQSERLKLQERVKELEAKERLEAGEDLETVRSDKNQLTETVKGDTRKKSFPTYSDLESYPGQFVAKTPKD